MDGIMANTFDEAIKLFNQIGKEQSDTVWVEIGSERGEGSTMALAGQAERWHTVLHSVDISDYCWSTLKYPSLICHVAKGSVWTKNYSDTIGKRISMLYLDNFDWIYDVHHVPPHVNVQIEKYQKEFKEIMNNRRCQREHLAQIINLMPWLNDDCIVAMDDTYLLDGIWTGKCGAGAVYLETFDFETVYYSSGGTVMIRGFPGISRLTLDGVLCII